MAGTTGLAMFDAYVAANYDSLVASFGSAARHGIDPHDVVHDALLVSYRKLTTEPDAFASTKDLHAYVRVVGIRLVSALTVAGAAQVPLTDDDAVSVTRLDPERLVVSRDALERVLKRLSPRHLRALVMVVEGLSSEEIAQALGLPNRQAANAVVYRARVEARREFDLIRHAGIGAAFRLRHIREDGSQLASHASTLIGTVALSLLAVVAAPVVPAAPGDRTASRPWGGRPALLSAGAQAPGAGRSGAAALGTGAVTQAASLAAAAPDVSPEHGRRPLSSLAIDPPTTPCVRVCIASDGARGEVIRVKPLGPGAPQVTQDVTPMCDRVPDNAAVECERGQEPDEWIVKDLPPIPVPESGGTAP